MIDTLNMTNLQFFVHAAVTQTGSWRLVDCCLVMCMHVLRLRLSLFVRRARSAAMCDCRPIADTIAPDMCVYEKQLYAV